MDIDVDPPKIIGNHNIKVITSQPTINSPLVVKPIPINKTHSISPEPAFKRMRII